MDGGGPGAVRRRGGCDWRWNGHDFRVRLCEEGGCVRNTNGVRRHSPIGLVGCVSVLMSELPSAFLKRVRPV